MNKTKIPPEEEKIHEVQRGIPLWLQELEGASAAINKRLSLKKEKLSENQ